MLRCPTSATYWVSECFHGDVKVVLVCSINYLAVEHIQCAHKESEN